jgi:hypothetical protein|tara:strand:+ start:2347 stop:2511 length:165 start_codon:yes stop_codon:yes gene_type:complete
MSTNNNPLNYLENYKTKLSNKKKKTKQQVKFKSTTIHGLGKLKGLNSFANKYKK